MGMSVANIRISSKVLMELLDFKPTDSLCPHRVINAFMDRDYLDTVVLTIEHPDLPEGRLGDAIPYIKPMYKAVSAMVRVKEE